MKAKIQTTVSGLSQEPQLSNPSLLTPHELAQSSNLPLPTHEPETINTNESFESLPMIEYGHENEAIPQLPDSPPSPATSEPSDTLLVPLSDLWDAISNSRYRSLGGNRDLFEELQEVLSLNAEMLSTPFVQSRFPAPGELSHGEAVRDDDFGIELPGRFVFLICCRTLAGQCAVNADDDIPSSNSTQTKLSPEHPTYPWPTKAVSVRLLPVHDCF